MPPPSTLGSHKPPSRLFTDLDIALPPHLLHVRELLLGDLRLEATDAALLELDGRQAVVLEGPRERVGRGALHQQRDGVARGLRGKTRGCMQSVEIAAPLASYYATDFAPYLKRVDMIFGNQERS